MGYSVSWMKACSSVNCSQMALQSSSSGKLRSGIPSIRISRHVCEQFSQIHSCVSAGSHPQRNLIAWRINYKHTHTRTRKHSNSPAQYRTFFICCKHASQRCIFRLFGSKQKNAKTDRWANKHVWVYIAWHTCLNKRP